MENIKWWYRNISLLGVRFNCAIHADPDMITMTAGGKVLMVKALDDPGAYSYNRFMEIVKRL